MKLEVTRGIECGERGYGDESGECGFRGEWDGGVECGSNRVKLRLNMELDVIVMEMNVDISVEMVMLKELETCWLSSYYKPIVLHPLPNQSKPIVPTPSSSYNFSLYLL